MKRIHQTAFRKQDRGGPSQSMESILAINLAALAALESALNQGYALALDGDGYWRLYFVGEQEIGPLAQDSDAAEAVLLLSDQANAFALGLAELEAEELRAAQQ